MPKYDGPRFERKRKKRTANRILNGLIGFVCVLILFFAIITLWPGLGGDTAAPTEGNSSGGEQENAPSSEDQVTDEPDVNIEDEAPMDQDEDSTLDQDNSVERQNPDTNASETDRDRDATEGNTGRVENDEASDERPSRDDVREEDTDEEDTDKEEGNDEVEPLDPNTSDDPNVIEVMEGPWGPVGTSQTGEHLTDFDESSVDGQERMEVISLATGLAEDDMILWWNGNYNGNTNQVVATVSPSDQSAFFRLYMQWVPDKGWQVSEMQRLKENDQ
ncbi:DUF1510 family protein [Bacillaceae bacterium SIJ1]|uniref:YrrS family protein n=1 Tax=Litoribacterium kuwaitense TaxID=1398745 RepID=UPI0013EBB2CD|nr:YrrS family protein [Litoribacterium kuwaitense]NGP43465.1 DUF1510 family protein [Litoribacterium kuwaitense]